MNNQILFFAAGMLFGWISLSVAFYQQSPKERTYTYLKNTSEGAVEIKVELDHPITVSWDGEVMTVTDPG